MIPARPYLASASAAGLSPNNNLFREDPCSTLPASGDPMFDMIPASEWAVRFTELFKANCPPADWPALQPDVYFLQRYTTVLDNDHLLPPLPAPTWKREPLRQAFEYLHDAASIIYQEEEQREKTQNDKRGSVPSRKRTASGIHGILKRFLMVLKTLGIELPKRPL